MELKIKKEGDVVTVTKQFKMSGSMMEMEDQIQEAVNDIGSGLTREALSQFDTNGKSLTFGSVKMTSKKKTVKEYQTPYGPVSLSRYIYQGSKGGKTYCPVDSEARIIVSSTPRFASIVTSKYANQCSQAVKSDLEISNGRKVSRNYIQNLSETVGAMSIASEEEMDYEIPSQDEPVSTVVLSLDGTTVLMKGDGYREAMTGTISLYDNKGERLHTIYFGSAPEYGKELFLKKMSTEINKIKEKFPDATYLGIADGAQCNWKFLDQYTTVQILDFYHATEYLAGASEAFAKGSGKRKQWLNSACHDLKHDANGAKTILKEMKKMKKNISSSSKKTTVAIVEKLDKAITYFTNQMKRMDYHNYRKNNFAIGSGVTEAACKTLIKQRLCNSGMKWKNTGAQIVISLRALCRTDGRWSQFWKKVNLQGLQAMRGI